MQPLARDSSRPCECNRCRLAGHMWTNNCEGSQLCHRNRTEQTAKAFSTTLLQRHYSKDSNQTVPKPCKALETVPCKMAHTIFRAHTLQRYAAVSDWTVEIYGHFCDPLSSTVPHLHLGITSAATKHSVYKLIDLWKFHGFLFQLLTTLFFVRRRLNSLLQVLFRLFPRPNIVSNRSTLRSQLWLTQRCSYITTTFYPFNMRHLKGAEYLQGI